MDALPVTGFTTDLFAGIAVTDLEVSVAWYEQLLGHAPSFNPNDIEAVWAVGDNQWLYIVADPDRAGRAIVTLLGADLDAFVAAVSDRGLDPDREEAPEENTRKIVYLDPDGNEIGFASVNA